ncbi:MAG: hypothetical protein AAF678_01200 [Pseudomonadota bacterium]
MSRAFALIFLGLASLSLGATANEAPVQKTDEADVTCDVCSARKQGLKRKNEAREAQTTEEAGVASAEPEDATSDE